MNYVVFSLYFIISNSAFYLIIILQIIKNISIVIENFKKSTSAKI